MREVVRLGIDPAAMAFVRNARPHKTGHLGHVDTDGCFRCHDDHH